MHHGKENWWEEETGSSPPPPLSLSPDFCPETSSNGKDFAGLLCPKNVIASRLI